MAIRKLVFQESAKNNVAISEEKRNMILNNISNKLDTDAKTIEKIMWSDLEENTVIDDYYPIDLENCYLTIMFLLFKLCFLIVLE